ncbi:MAG: HAD-IC family P-type ATPase, partial [Eggerthellaceae bacterium]|nr:HAD-IC family P-type ATPase [Eggerthellaceae bacterium]
MSDTEKEVLQVDSRISPADQMKRVMEEERNGRLRYAAQNPEDAVLSTLHTSLTGLDEKEVEESRDEHGSNKVTHEKRKSLGARLAEAFVNPFTAILGVLALVSFATDILFPAVYLFNGTPEDIDPMTVIIILVMVILSGTLRFVQETRSGNAAEHLLAMITTTTCVVREGVEQEIDLNDVVVGDIVRLAAGDMVPADMRILSANDLFVNQSSLTGESEPAEKVPVAVERNYDAIYEYPNLAFMGSNVISGSATGVVVVTGDETLFGAMTQSAATEPVETSFTKGVNAVSWVLIRFMLVMVPLVFVINGLTKGDWLEAFLFGISIAVGLTPEMLPMIVTTCLAKGAVAMSKKKTIIKNLNSIQNFGAIDVLCTDKTGTLTQDQVVL